jgi:hypothetical protein
MDHVEIVSPRIWADLRGSQIPFTTEARSHGEGQKRRTRVSAQHGLSRLRGKADSSPLTRLGMTRFGDCSVLLKLFALTPWFGNHDELHAQGVQNGIDGFKARVGAGA